MMISIYNLYEATLLIINAIAILHEERFLNKVGFGKFQQQEPHEFGQPVRNGFKQNLVNLIHSVRVVMRVPLIFLNILTIIIKLISG